MVPIEKPIRVALLATSQIPASKGEGRALGIEALGLFLQKSLEDQVTVSLVDMQYEGGVAQAVNKALEDQNLDILGLSVRYGSYAQMEQSLDLLEKLDRVQNKQLFVVVGGVIPTFLATDIVQQYPFATVVSGEGELALRELTTTIRDKGDLNNVPGLTYYNPELGKVVSNLPQNLPLADTSSPAIITDLVPQLKEKQGIVWMSSSRGCPWDCSFCSVSAFREVTGAKGSTRREVRPVDHVISELQQLYDLGFREFVFADDEMLVGNPAHLNRWHQLADGIKNIGPDISFQCSVRSDVIAGRKDRDAGKARRIALKALVEAGLSSVYIGFESGSPTQLKRYNKGLTVEDHMAAIGILRQEGVLVGGGMIMFDPLMTTDELLENVAFLRKSELISAKRKDFVGDVFDALRIQQATHFVTMLDQANLLGKHIPGTLFYEFRFQNPAIAKIANTCVELSDQIDNFFEALKYTVFAMEIADERRSEVSSQTRMLNGYLIDLRLLDLDLLEDLVTATRDDEAEQVTFNMAVAKYTVRRKGLITSLQNDLVAGRVSDADAVETLLAHISEIPGFDSTQVPVSSRTYSTQASSTAAT